MAPSYLEDNISKIPALQLLLNLGFEYLSPAETLVLRNNKKSAVLLEPILIERLKEINMISFKGENLPFSEASILSAIDDLKNIVFDGLVRTNEKIYDLITLGKSMQQTIVGDTKSFTLNFIDWKNIHNNKFHVTQEFEVEKEASWETRRPDLVLFVNGIPFAVIECKRPDLRTEDPIAEGISQHIRNQKQDETPKLFTYSQLLLSLAVNNASYGTIGTPAKFWAQWKEKTNTDEELKSLINRPLNPEVKKIILQDLEPNVRHYFETSESGDRLPTEQDKLIYSLCRPERLLEIAFQFIVFDGGTRKVARYQQYFAVKDTISRVKSVNQGKRTGGVVWHTQGSGKSITMVLIAKAIALTPEIKNPKIILVTDRVELDDQIFKTFKACGLDAEKAKTGSHLLELLTHNKATLITTIVNKFQAGLKTKKFKDHSENIFALVDESHRTQYGEMNVAMHSIFPNACFIAFTGTPLNKHEKNTAAKFGGFIGSPYTMQDAVNDKAVVPLLYEGRHIPQSVNESAVDKWFERVTENLSDDQKKDLKKKFSNSNKLNEAEQKIKVTAYDISEHFLNNWKHTGFKGQLVTPSKRAALLFKKYLDECGYVSSEVLISAPDTREGHEDVYEDVTDEVQTFWKRILQKYGNKETYEKQLVAAFKKANEPEIIIVVEKLLTGFDAPKNAVLYLTTNLKEHTLLQAIARVNRLCEGKDYGYIVDYYGVIENLDSALTTYTEWKDFDVSDLESCLTSLDKEAASLQQKHAELWDIFKTISNKKDNEEYEQFLADEAIRHDFYERLSNYARTLQIALSSVKFAEKTPKQTIKRYKDDFKFFLNLRASVQRRYAEKIDFKEYEQKVQKLVDTYVSSEDVMQLTDLVNIFDAEKFQAEVERIVGDAAKADTIASRTKKTINEKMHEDPAFYTKFSKLLEDAIKAFRDKRITEAEYLAKVKTVMESVQNRTGDDIPECLSSSAAAKAFYGVILESLKPISLESTELKEEAARVALEIDNIIRSKMVVDFVHKEDVQNKMQNAIDDLLFELRGNKFPDLSLEQIDSILSQSMDITKHRYA